MGVTPLSIHPSGWRSYVTGPKRDGAYLLLPALDPGGELGHQFILSLPLSLGLRGHSHMISAERGRGGVGQSMKIVQIGCVSVTLTRERVSKNLKILRTSYENGPFVSPSFFVYLFRERSGSSAPRDGRLYADPSEFASKRELIMPFHGITLYG